MVDEVVVFKKLSGLALRTAPPHASRCCRARRCRLDDSDTLATCGDRPGIGVAWNTQMRQSLMTW